MNPTAQSFSPGAGSKHPRDDGQPASDIGGKRMRGGGGGS
jgi:hypothetical protein